jgi:PST family polysaccharide transporter
MLNGIAVVAKLLAMLGVNKILAIYLGPAGYASIGFFQNLTQMVTTLASGASNIGVTKYTAEHYTEESKQRDIWRTATAISFIASIILSGGVVAFNQQLATIILNDKALGSVFVWFGLLLIFGAFNTLLLAILNGKKQIVSLVAANVLGSVVALAITAVLTIQYKLYGALVAIAVYQSIAFITTILICRRQDWFRVAYFIGPIKTSAVRNLLKYGLMTITTAVCVPISHILVRHAIGESLGWEAAGYWEAMWRLSAAYLMVITSALSVYFLPTLAGLTTAKALKREIINGYKVIMPAVIILSIAIYIARDLLIKLLFDRNFSDMQQLFGWQMVGDTLKIGSWLLSYLMLSKSMTRLYIGTEVMFTAIFVGLVSVCLGLFGLQGAAVAHAITYALYWITMYLLVYRKIFIIASRHS